MNFWLLKVDALRAILALAIMLALWRGKWPERATAAIFIGMFGSDELYHVAFHHAITLGTIDIGHFMIDLAAAIAFGLIALRANRIYPICIAGFQLMSLCSHFLKLMSPTINGQAYGILIGMPSYLETLSFAIGVMTQLGSGPIKSLAWEAIG